MTDTPRSNAPSPVVFLGSGGPDLTAPEQVDKSVGMAMQHGLHNTAATLRALAAKLEAAEARERALLQANDQERKALVENASLRHRLKVAEGERDALDAAWSERVALLEKTISEAESERDAALGYIRDNAVLCLTSEHDEDEMWLLDLDTLRHWRDVQIVAARDLLVKYEAGREARQKGGEG